MSRHNNIVHKALYEFLVGVKQAFASSSTTDSVPNCVNLDELTCAELRVFVRLAQTDPQAAYDQLFAPPRYKEKVIRSLNEYAQKRILALHSEENSVEYQNLTHECNHLHDGFPMFAKWKSNK